MTANEVPSGVSNCYVFKSRLQEYAQKYKLPTPLYETIKEGPSHKPVFQSTVIVNDVRYDSLPGFFNRKAAEQSAAEVALQELAKSSDLSQCVSLPVHEMGLCKNLLQEYAQKMNYAIPLYQCQRSETTHGRAPQFTCTVDLGGIKYTGAATKTKKEAEISAGRTALIAIQSESKINLANNYSTHQLTVLPCEKVASPVKETIIKTPKAKKAQFKKKARKGKRKVLAKDLEDSEILLPQPTEQSVNDQPENAETLINMEPSSCMNGFKDLEESSTVLPRPIEHCQNEQLSLEPSTCMNGFKEAALASVETEASEA